MSESDQDSPGQAEPAGYSPDRTSEQTLMGSETVVHGLNTYISNNNPMSIIVIIPDSFGWRFTNTRRIADEICERTGATVYVPDFMNGDSYPLKYNDFMPTKESPPQPFHLKWRAAIALKIWYYRHRDSKCRVTINNFFKNLHHENSDRRVFAAGYCWGARQAMLLASKDSSIIPDGFEFVDAIYAASPLRLAFPEELHAVCKPICLALGSDDKFLPKNSIEESKNWVAQKAPEGSEVHVYPGAPHDFALQVRFGTPGQKYNKKATLGHAERFFNAILDGPI